MLRRPLLTGRIDRSIERNFILTYQSLEVRRLHAASGGCIICIASMLLLVALFIFVSSNSMGMLPKQINNCCSVVVRGKDGTVYSIFLGFKSTSISFVV